MGWKLSQFSKTAKIKYSPSLLMIWVNHNYYIFSPHSKLSSTSWLYTTHHMNDGCSYTPSKFTVNKIHNSSDMFISCACNRRWRISNQFHNSHPFTNQKIQTANHTFPLHITRSRDRWWTSCLSTFSKCRILFLPVCMCNTLQTFLVNCIFHIQTTQDYWIYSFLIIFPDMNINAWHCIMHDVHTCSFWYNLSTAGQM